MSLQKSSRSGIALNSAVVLGIQGKLPSQSRVHTPVRVYRYRTASLSTLRGSRGCTSSQHPRGGLGTEHPWDYMWLHWQPLSDPTNCLLERLHYDCMVGKRSNPFLHQVYWHGFTRLDDISQSFKLGFNMFPVIKNKDLTRISSALTGPIHASFPNTRTHNHSVYIFSLHSFTVSFFFSVWNTMLFYGSYGKVNLYHRFASPPTPATLYLAVSPEKESIHSCLLRLSEQAWAMFFWWWSVFIWAWSAAFPLRTVFMWAQSTASPTAASLS